ncbi:alpha/beta fold hydrolase [Chitinophaga sp. MM2321]|uniref:alpha/beta hydrolase n=1 Tax=Chitinophaga sp. MM2321 TaxID=3137178 RepID=UPI0032D5AF8D
MPQRSYRIALIILALWLPAFFSCKQSPPYRDLTHNSAVFGHKKFYRLYLPDGYNSTATRYPVIYFFHGWGGRHFKDDNAKLAYEKLQQLVDKYKVILVMWDGNIDEQEPRPYNVGNHEDVKFEVQMKDYFPELVNYIDSAYRTEADRRHRGIIGFSMGGIMSFFLAGKYPDKVSAAVSMTGSPEFFIGYPHDHTLYPLRYTFKNLQQVSTSMHTSDSDILYYLNEEVRAGALWEGGVSFAYHAFKGGHMVDKPGETKVFDTAMRFVVDAFKNPLPPAKLWSHYDLYPDFKVWGYEVASNKQTPGFIFLRNVDKSGFGLYTRKWLPDGPSLPDVESSVLTAPVYTPGHTYQVVTWRAQGNNTDVREVKSDEQGRLSFKLDAAGSEVGIFDKKDAPAFICLDYKVGDNSRYLGVSQHNRLTLRLLNRGGENNLPQEVKVTVSAVDSAIALPVATSIIKATPGQRILTLPPLEVACNKVPPPHAEPWQVKLKVVIQVGDHTFNDELTVPVWFNTTAFDQINIDDGKAVRDTVLGSGNGNGIAEAGEKIMLYQGTNRLRIYTEDPWVHQELVEEIIPARWPDGFTSASVLRIAPGCPDGHEINCLASYETKTFNPIERKVTWGKVKLTVRHK